MRYLVAALLAGGLLYVFYYGLLETGVLKDASTPEGYYGKYVDGEMQLVHEVDTGYYSLQGWHRNVGNRDLRDITVTVMLPDADGRVVEVGMVRLGRLSSGDEKQIEGNVGVPEDFPAPTRRFKYRIEAEFVDEEGD